MKVRGKSEKFYDVDIEQGTCSCSCFAERRQCSHLFLASDIFKKKAQHFHYEMKQAFICEIRRSKPDAINWGRLICKAKGTEYFVRLCRFLIRTETRNLTALENSYQTNDPGKILELLFTSKKIHENPYYLHAFSGAIDALHKYNSIHYKKFQSPVAMLREFIEGACNLETAYIVLYFIEDNPEILNSFVRMLYDKAVDERNHALIRYLETGDMHLPESWRFACELMVRFWSMEAEASPHVYPENLESMIPSFRDYQKPMKTLRDIFKKHHLKIRPNKKLASDIRCDLRFSDSYFGFFWRSLAMLQKGHTEDLAGEEVEFSVNEWLSAQILDKRYYPSLYHDILLAG